jgi:hypothetical protein
VDVDVRPWTRFRARTTFFDTIDVYASPSALEGGPLPVFEAAAVGTPVATTDVGMAEQLLARGGALSLPVDDARGQADVLIGLARLSSAEREQLGRQHRAEAYECAGPPALAHYEALWTSFAGRPASEPLGHRVARSHNRMELVRDRLAEGKELVRLGRFRDAARELVAGAGRFPPTYVDHRLAGRRRRAA